jgi:DNA gyrase subunit A
MLQRALGEEVFHLFQEEYGTGEGYALTAVQADAILRMTLGQLVNLEQEKLGGEHRQLLEEITEYQRILADEKNMLEIIKDDLAEIKRKHANARRTEVSGEEIGSIDMEDLITEETMVVSISHRGYIKRTPTSVYRAQRRGGKGLKGAKTEDEDPIEHLFVASTHAYLLFFSTRGRVYRLKAHEVPMTSRTARGTSVVNLLPLQPDERIQAVIDTRDYETHRFLFFATRSGRVKKTRFTAYDSSLRAGLIAIRLNDGDEVVEVVPTNGDDQLLLTSRSGQTLRFSEKVVRSMGRNVAGVIGMRFRDGDELASCAVVRPGCTVLHLSSEGFGKRTLLDEFPIRGRAGLGVRGIRTTDDRGSVAGAVVVSEEDQVFIVSTGGVIIRVPVAEISIQGRTATGVRVMSPDEGQHVAALSRAPAESTVEESGADD